MVLLLVFPGLTQVAAFSWQLGGGKVQDVFTQTIVSGAFLRMPRELGAFSVHVVIHHSPQLLYMVSGFQEGKNRSCKFSYDGDPKLKKHQSQNKSQGQPGFKWRGNRHHLLMRKGHNYISERTWGCEGSLSSSGDSLSHQVILRSPQGQDSSGLRICSV